MALATEIERERESRENAATHEPGASPVMDGRHGMGTQDGAVKLGNDTAVRDGEGDVKMEG